MGDRTPSVQPSGVLQFFVISASLIVIIAGMRVAAPIIVPFLLAVFLTILVSPFFSWMRAKGVPWMLALTLVILSLVIVLSLIASLIASSAGSFSENLPAYQTRLKELTSAAAGQLNRWGIISSADSLRQYVNPGAVMNLINGFIAGLSSVFANVFLIGFLVIFLLIEETVLEQKIRVLLADSESSATRVRTILKNIQHYFAMKTWVSLAAGVAITILLAIMGVDFALLWGLLAFLFNFIPNIGSILAAIPGILMALIQLGAGPAAIAAAGYLVINTVIGNIIEPRLFGKELGLSTFVIIVSLVFWGWVLGPVGMFLSVPMTMTLKIILNANDSTRWLAILMGSAPPALAEEDPA